LGYVAAIAPGSRLGKSENLVDGSYSLKTSHRHSLVVLRRNRKQDRLVTITDGGIKDAVVNRLMIPLKAVNPAL
jgi:hypothetical protein